MEVLTLKEIAKALNTKTDFDVQINAVCIDTRKITKGCLFICIKGERFDAHQFANEALSLGAAAVMISEDIEVNGAFVKLRILQKHFLTFQPIIVQNLISLLLHLQARSAKQLQRNLPIL